MDASRADKVTANLEGAVWPKARVCGFRRLLAFGPRFGLWTFDGKP